jgi:beta-lactamase superfamily II metal-dependent hydrolase
MLIDGGDVAHENALYNYLTRHGITSIDVVVLTHPHADHVGGLNTVLGKMTVGTVVDAAYPSTTATYEKLLRQVDTKNIKYTVARRGQSISFDNNVRVNILWPTDAKSDDANENSVVIRMSYGSIDFLFMGDANTKVENSLLSYTGELDSEVLKVGHHGSSTSTSANFLAKVSPETSIIEVGAGNNYGHPTEETLQRLEEAGSTVYRTDVDGGIVVNTDGKSYTVVTHA